MTTFDPGLQDLLGRLARVGLRVGPAELLRLQWLFAADPPPGSGELAAVLAAVLVKSEADGKLFREAYQGWQAQGDALIRRGETGGAPAVASRPAGPLVRLIRPGPGAGPWRVPLPQLLVLLVLLGGAGLLFHGPAWWDRKPEVPRPTPATGASTTLQPAPGSARPGSGLPVEPTRGKPTEPQPTSETDDLPPPPPRQLHPLRLTSPLAPYFPDWVVVRVDDLGPLPRPARPFPGLPLAVALAAAGLAAFLFHRSRRPVVQPVEPLPEPAPGPSLFRLPPAPAGPGPELLTLLEQEDVVAGVGRFVSEEPGDELDPERSIEDTVAAGGLPRAVFELRRCSREVWLWLDEATEDPAAARLAAELRETLVRSGLPVEEARCWGFPDRLRPPEGREVAPAELDERREAAVVLLFTDGQRLLDRLASAVTGPETRVLLRELARWPRLAVIDFGGRLTPALRPFGLEVCRPEDATRVLGATGRRSLAPDPDAPLTGDALAWAAVTALPPDPVPEATALALRRKLRLTAPAWLLRHLGQPAGHSRLLRWSPAERTRLLQWLADLGEDAPLRDAALAFWDQQYQHLVPAAPQPKNRARARAPARARSDSSTAAQTNRAAVPDPPEALADLTNPAAHRIYLHRQLLALWQPPTLDQLRELRRTIAADRPPSDRTDLQQELYDAATEELRHLADRDAPRPPPDAPPDQRTWVNLPWRLAERSPQQRHLLLELGFGQAARGHRPATQLRPSRRLRLGAWTATGLAVAATLATLFNLTSLPDPPRPAARPVLRVVPTERDLTLHTVHQVEEDPLTLTPPRGPVQALALPTDRRYHLTWHLARPTCPRQTAVFDGLTYVWVCPGLFRMGSEAGDQAAYEDEQPAHWVRLSGFWIGRTEVSRAEFDRWGKGRQQAGSGDRPAVEVDWNEADRFCRDRGGRLPTEAEWEYAARGWDGRRFPWGDAPPDADRAVFEKRSRTTREQYVDQTEAIISHPAGTGPFGTLHQAGNVWEWMAECYVDASSRQGNDKLRTDPLDQAEACGRRVVRSGSYWDVAKLLRSAYWGGFEPGDRFDDVGFRYVRVPHRQP